MEHGLLTVCCFATSEISPVYLIFSISFGKIFSLSLKYLCAKNDSVAALIDACEQPKLEGPCRGNFSRWYFEKEERACKEFIYGGCKGTGNNFLTEKACQNQCLQPGKSRGKLKLKVHIFNSSTYIFGVPGLQGKKIGQLLILFV